MKGHAVYLTHQGKTLSISSWARTLNLVPATLRKRLEKGWSIEKALSPRIRKQHTLTYKGQTKLVSKWALELDIPYATLMRRVKLGWTPEQILTTTLYVKRK